jgi:uncharacterized membrane protein
VCLNKLKICQVNFVVHILQNTDCSLLGCGSVQPCRWLLHVCTALKMGAMLTIESLLVTHAHDTSVTNQVHNFTPFRTSNHSATSLLILLAISYFY